MHVPHEIADYGKFNYEPKVTDEHKYILEYNTTTSNNNIFKLSLGNKIPCTLHFVFKWDFLYEIYIF